MSVRFRPRPRVVPAKKKTATPLERKTTSVNVPGAGPVSIESIFEALARVSVEQRSKLGPQTSESSIQLQNGINSLMAPKPRVAAKTTVDAPVIMVFSGTGVVDPNGVFQDSFVANSSPSATALKANTGDLDSKPRISASQFRGGTPGRNPSHWRGTPGTTDEAINRIAAVLVGLTGQKIP